MLLNGCIINNLNGEEMKKTKTEEQVFSLIEKTTKAKNAKEVLELFGNGFEENYPAAMGTVFYSKKDTNLFKSIWLEDKEILKEFELRLGLQENLKIEKKKVIAFFGKEFNSTNEGIEYTVNNKTVSFSFEKELLKEITISNKIKEKVEPEKREREEDKVLAFVVKELYEAASKELEEQQKTNPIKVPANYLESKIEEKLRAGRYTEEQIEDALIFYAKLKDENKLSELLGDLQVIYPANKILEHISLQPKKLDSLMDAILNNKEEEIRLEYHLRTEPGTYLVLGFEANDSNISALIKKLDSNNARIVGGTAILLGQIKNAQALDKLLEALKKIQEQAKQNLGEWREGEPWRGGEQEYVPSDYEFAESAIGDAIISITVANKIERKEKIVFKRTVSQHVDVVGTGRFFSWNLIQVEFDLKTRQEVESLVEGFNSGTIGIK